MKHAIVSGAAGALGSAMVEMFLQQDYRVTGTINEHASRLSFNQVAVDLRDEAATARMVEEVTAQYGSPEAAVLTVGSFRMGGLDKTGAADVREQFDSNFFSAWNLALPVFRVMKQAGRGRIFLTGSLAGEDPKKSKQTVAYGLSKNLLFALADILNADSGKADVHTTVLVPSVIDTPQNRRSMPDADASGWIPPASIAAAVGYHLTGAGWIVRNRVLRVTGGL